MNGSRGCQGQQEEKERETQKEREYIKDIWLLLTIQEIAFGGWERKGRVFDLSIMIYLYTAFLQRGKKKQLYIHFGHNRHNINAIIIKNIHSEPILVKHCLTPGYIIRNQNSSVKSRTKIPITIIEIKTECANPQMRK